jgi:hypothetical protein
MYHYHVLFITMNICGTDYRKKKEGAAQTKGIMSCIPPSSLEFLCGTGTLIRGSSAGHCIALLGPSPTASRRSPPASLGSPPTWVNLPFIPITHTKYHIHLFGDGMDRN